MTLENIGHLAVSLSLLLIAALNGWFIWWIRTRRLQRNFLIGIRTRATLRDEQSWERAHDAAVPPLWLTLIVAVALAAAVLVLRETWLTLSAPVVPLVLMFIAAVRGHWAVRSA